MILKTAECALWAIVGLAEAYNESRSTQKIVEMGKVPVGYPAKVMQSLSRAGIVKSQRGLNGGFALAKWPEDISILEVVSVANPIQRIKERPLGLKAREETLPFAPRIGDVAAHVETSSRKTFIADGVTESVRVGYGVTLERNPLYL